MRVIILVLSDVKKPKPRRKPKPEKPKPERHWWGKVTRDGKYVVWI